MYVHTMQFLKQSAVLYLEYFKEGGKVKVSTNKGRSKLNWIKIYRARGKCPLCPLPLNAPQLRLTRPNGHFGGGGQLHPTPQLLLQLFGQRYIGWVLHNPSHKEGTLEQRGCTQRRGAAHLMVAFCTLNHKH